LGDVDDAGEVFMDLIPLWSNEHPNPHYDRSQVDDWEWFESEQMEKASK